MEKTTRNRALQIVANTAGSVLFSVLCITMVIVMIGGLFYTPRSGGIPDTTESIVSIMDSYDGYVAAMRADTEEVIRDVPKHFWIHEDALAGPKPDQSRFGQAQSATELQWLLDEAAPLLEGQETAFHTGIEILEGSVIQYYLDDTILAITWKQVFDNFVYTISEVKVQDPSQFRRYIADGQYDIYKFYHTTQMSEMTNAVVASSADFYKARSFGIVVYDSLVRKVTVPHLADTCFIDRSGNLQFSYRGELKDMEDAQRFVDEKDILFSLAFGPILIDNGEVVQIDSYLLGEIKDPYPRAALCQKDDLHYLVVAATAEGRYSRYTDIRTFAKNLATLGCQKAYALDGGRTITIAMNHQLINKVNYPEPRMTSDIIYFATAIPNISQDE